MARMRLYRRIYRLLLSSTSRDVLVPLRAEYSIRHIKKSGKNGAFCLTTGKASLISFRRYHLLTLSLPPCYGLKAHPAFVLPHVEHSEFTKRDLIVSTTRYRSLSAYRNLSESRRLPSEVSILELRNDHDRPLARHHFEHVKKPWRIGKNRF